MSVTLEYIEYPPGIADFEDDLAMSESPEVYALLFPALHYLFPEAATWRRVHDILQQKEGLDLLLDELKMQHKARRTNFDDFLIEYNHAYDSGFSKPGWIWDYCVGSLDWLLYVQIPLRKASLIPIESLSAAWEATGIDWLMECYEPPASRNNGYRTENIAVKWDMLGAAGVPVRHVIVPEPHAESIA